MWWQVDLHIAMCVVLLYLFIYCYMLKKANVALGGVEYPKEVIFRSAEQNLPES